MKRAQSKADKPSAKYRLLNEQYSVDVVVPVYNALEDVKHCLRALLTHTDGFTVRVFVVDDGSREDTASWLRDFCEENSSAFILLVNEENRGYTATVNRGLKASSADYVATLNSDTRVTAGWLTSLVRCIRSDEEIGIAGPLSNAASWQNVPELFDGGAFAVNELPQGFSPNDMAQCVRLASYRSYPRVPFVNGFCFMIDRRVVEKIGYLDEETFPTGYGEENDYCLRAAEAGFSLAIADDAYVFHAKSKSFGHETRKTLAKRGGAALKVKHGEDTVNEKAQYIREMTELSSIRKRVGTQLQDLIAAEKGVSRKGRALRVLFCLPVSGGGGGVHSVVQETQGMRRLGIHVAIGVPMKHREKYLRAYADIPSAEELFVGVKPGRWARVSAEYDVLVGTIYTSMRIVQSAVASNPGLLPAYYIQDYEPLFFEPGSASWAEARQSYELVPEAVLFAKTDWIRNKVLQEHGMYVHKVSPSIDHAVYRPAPALKQSRAPEVKAVVSAMVRPKTPRRGPVRTMEVLAKLKTEFGESVRIEVFGADVDDPFFTGASLSSFDYVSHGVLTRPEVAKVLQRSDLFIDLSDYQAFGRTALEAMATGASVVVPKWGGTNEYSWSASCVEVDPFDADTAEQIVNLVKRGIVYGFESLQAEAARTASLFSVDRAATSEAGLLRRAAARGWGAPSYPSVGQS